MRTVESAIDAETAFPMFVRGTARRCARPGRQGVRQSVDPDEMKALDDIAGRVGIALDALQTVAMRRELAALIEVQQQSTPRAAPGGATSGVSLPV